VHSGQFCAQNVVLSMAVKKIMHTLQKNMPACIESCHAAVSSAGEAYPMLVPMMNQLSIKAVAIRLARMHSRHLWHLA
jgi:hypothetical protein